MLLLVEVGLAILACYRLSQLLAIDDGPYNVFLEWRKWLGRRANGSTFWHNVAEMFHCPFCLGVWFAFPLALLIDGNFLLLWLGIAGGQAFLEELRNDDAQ